MESYYILLKIADAKPLPVKITKPGKTVRDVLAAADVKITQAEKASDFHGRSLTLDTVVTKEMHMITVSASPKNGR